jgi:hypothetical protein
MRSLVRGGGRLRRIVLATGLGAWAWVVPASVYGADGGPAGAGLCPTCHKPLAGRHKHPGPGDGTLGYGKPGLYPGFQGFGLGYHPGYGYGGAALGVGADGGYPFYGGPGYPHPWPALRRFGSINPFPYYGGPGGPSPGHPNYFGGVGPLAPDQPVVVVEREPRDPAYTDGYGGFTGMVPYPETTFAPFVTISATGGSSSGVSSSSPPNSPPNTAPAPGELLDERAASRSLGIDAEPFVDSGRGRGLKITGVHRGSAAEKAGLRVGDVIHSINGYRTELPSSLAWIIANVAPDRVLTLSVHSASDGRVCTITTQLP